MSEPMISPEFENDLRCALGAGHAPEAFVDSLRQQILAKARGTRSQKA